MNEYYWDSIPVGMKNAVSYDYLCSLWGNNKRTVRRILHELSKWDNGDNYILIRSGHGKGFYKTDNEAELIAYRKECLNKGRSNFAPIKKINRVLKGNQEAFQISVFNNMKSVRISLGMSQPDVCKAMKERGCRIDVPTLSKMENGVFLPNPHYLSELAKIYSVEPRELLLIGDGAVELL